MLLIIVIFVTVVIGVFAFGAAVVTPSSVLGARLRALGGQQTQAVQAKPAMRERIEQALDPLSKAIPLSPSRRFPYPALADSSWIPRRHRRQLLLRRPRAHGRYRVRRRPSFCRHSTILSCSPAFPASDFSFRASS